MEQKISGLIVAAGRGMRAGGGIPKQYRVIAGKTVLRHAAEALLAHPAIMDLQIVIHRDDMDLYRDATKGLPVMPVVFGGKTRSDSVLTGLKALEKSKPDTVLIHDAARPLLPIQVIDNLLDALQGNKAAVPCLKVVDALWRGDKQVEKPENRDNLWRAQTPQGFDFKTILNAHQLATQPADDDVALARQMGIKVAITTGSEQNFKITTVADFARAEKELTNMDIRTGNGFDVHAFGAGEFVTLCGVQIPHSNGLSGHSDADVAMHAVTDAIFGALCEGDIGQWFPPNDDQWKGANSAIFLEKAVQRVAERGFTLNHIDCTIICEMPKIGPHAAAMRAKMAEITGLTLDRISVKATTSERLGFTGRGEGIAAMATTTLVKS
ncbi:MAG: bifunctional 2-C-methyl-D-erythritol 4-phosphate cytidylyltransferase/2-C-methyl-D-erythritol 2,4-cyclodiphosphate synthase [Rhodobacteraceae bacterium]|nr:bifunctional 2-C-methyl-D-erythritol 4-phosphate cytidylyltransferase/2-C-methyl-D-erythritol 2,4-cyclodiphosphate synthase [Paracoccaceae bacterium]